MLSNKKTAEEIEKMVRECSSIPNNSIARVMETSPDERFKAYRRVIGRIMASIYVDVMQPIHQRCPDLEPEELKHPPEAG